MIILKRFSETVEESGISKAKKDLKFRAKRAKYRYHDTIDFYKNKEAVSENRKSLEGWVNSSKKRSGSNDRRQTIYHKNGMGPETIKDPEKYAFRKEETKRLEDAEQRMAEKSLKNFDKESKHPRLAAIKAAAKSLKEKTYSSEEEKKYKKAKRQRKQQKSNQDLLNGTILSGGIAAGYIGNTIAKESARSSLSHKVYRKRLKTIEAKWDKIQKAEENLDPIIKKWDEHHKKEVADYLEGARRTGVSPSARLQKEWDMKWDHIAKKNKWRSENRDKIQDAAEKWAEKKDSDAMLAADRLYKKKVKGIDRKTALIAAGASAAAVPFIIAGSKKRKKRDEEIEKLNPKRKSFSDNSDSVRREAAIAGTAAGVGLAGGLSAHHLAKKSSKLVDKANNKIFFKPTGTKGVRIARWKDGSKAMKLEEALKKGGEKVSKFAKSKGGKWAIIGGGSAALAGGAYLEAKKKNKEK